MMEIHARQVILDDRRNLQEVIESIMAKFDSMSTGAVETASEIVEEGETDEQQI